MPNTGVATINLPTVALADSVLINKDGSTSIIPVSDLATQLAGSGGIADALAQVEAQVTSGLLKLSTWAALMAKAPSEDGTGGEVIETDTGSHNDASATGYDGAVVDNHGRYSWVSAWGRWARIGEVVAYATAAQGAKADSAVQPVDLGSASASDLADFATAAQGAKADTAVQPGDITGSEPSRMVPGIFLNAPYYEFDGNTLYVKPAVFLSGNVAYIRGGYLANESFSYSQIKADLAAQSTPSGCALDATSPLGVTDCIQLGATSTLYYDPETGSWGWSTRTGQQTGYVKVLETNYGTIGNCTEQGVALAQLSGSESGGILALRANQPCTYITSRYGDYVPDFDPVARTLLIPNDLVFRIGAESYVVEDEFLIDLHPTSTASVVYLDIAASTITASGDAYHLDPPVFVVREYNDDWGGLSAADSENLILISISRITSGAYSGNSEITIGGPYRISGKRYGVNLPDETKAHVQRREATASSTVIRIAHRGGLWNGPENTIGAIKASYSLGEFDAVEGDIRFTSDNVPVLMHDATVDRTTDGTGTVTGLTAAQIQALDAGSHFAGGAFAGEPVPLLEDVFRLNKKLGFQSYYGFKETATQIQADIVLDLVQKTGLRGRVGFSGDDTTLSRILLTEPTQRIRVTDFASAIALRTQYSPVDMSVPRGSVDEVLVKQLHDAGINVLAYTINTSAHLLAMVELGADGIFTDGLDIKQILETDALS